jgi:hypothetical protein
MAATVFPDNTQTAFYALTDGNATDVYTVGDSGERAAYLVGVIVTDSTGSVSTAAKVVIYRNPTSWTLVPTAVGYPTDDWNLEWVATWPIRLKSGDEIRVTGASGHHVFVGYIPIGIDSGVNAQSAGGSAAQK